VSELAAENPVLRPASSDIALRCAVALGPEARSVPRYAVEEVVAGLTDADIARLVGLAEELAIERWSRLVREVGRELALEPLLVGVASAAIAELVAPPRWVADALLLLGRESPARELCRLLLVTAVLRRDGLVPLAPSQN
jgi:hypothetical protein